MVALQQLLGPQFEAQNELGHPDLLVVDEAQDFASGDWASSLT
jgi:hypothetical protein